MFEVVKGIKPFTKEMRGEITVKADLSTDGCVHIRMTGGDSSYRHLFLSIEDAKELRKMIRACRRYDLARLEDHTNEFYCRAIKSDFIRVSIGNGCRVHIQFFSRHVPNCTIYLSKLGAQCLESKIKIVRKQIKKKRKASE